MALFLGVDGGGSGCRAAIADAGGTILGRGEGGPANILSDFDEAHANIVQAAEQALRQALGPAYTDADLQRLHAGLGLAGANAAGVAGRLAASLPFAKTRVETDAVAAIKGALADNDGIVAAIGTGSVYAAQCRGTLRQIGGKGLVLGDEASGAWIGRALLSDLLRATDGFLAMTPLLSQVLARFGGAAAVIGFAAEATPADFAKLAPEVLASDDPAAQRILAQGCADVRAAVDLLQGQPPLPVVFLGGLGPFYRQHLQALWPMKDAEGTALDGALWLARSES